MKFKMIMRDDHKMSLHIGGSYIGFWLDEGKINPEGNYHLLHLEDIKNMVQVLSLAIKAANGDMNNGN